MYKEKMIILLTKRTLLGFIAIMCLVSNVNAAAPTPTPSTPAPFIHLNDNLDEPNGFGFCLDTYGRGQTDILHTHSCKPKEEGKTWDDRDNDIRFSMDSKTGQIASFGFKNLCMQALVAADVSVMALLECSDHPRQRFTYSEKDKTLRLKDDATLCIGVGPKTLPAPPYVRRPLELVKCDRLEKSRKQWEIVSKQT